MAPVTKTTNATEANGERSYWCHSDRHQRARCACVKNRDPLGHSRETRSGSRSDCPSVAVRPMFGVPFAPPSHVLANTQPRDLEVPIALRFD
jgi:hypothetical protein